jgi:tetratricopeptide (TPR) repeat protein
MTNAVAAAWLSAAVSVSVLLTGCDTTRPEEQPAYVKASAVEERVDRIEQQNHALIDMQHHVEVLEADVRRLRGEIEEANHELGSVRAQDREIHADFDKRLNAAEARATAAAAAASAAVSAQVTSEPTPAATPVVPTSADREAYQTAFEQLKARDYVAAEKSFKGFISRFPNSSYVDNAEYWLGETYYVGKRYGEALDIFVRMLKEHPDSRKAADAYLKAGFTEYELKRYKQARDYLNKVTHSYADTPAAAEARERLKRMDAERH